MALQGRCRPSLLIEAAGVDDNGVRYIRVALGK